MKYKNRKKDGFPDIIVKDGKTYVIEDQKSRDYQDYLAWVGEGNIAENYIDTENIETPKETAKNARKKAARDLKAKVKAKANLTKNEQAVLFEALIDLLGGE